MYRKRSHIAYMMRMLPPKWHNLFYLGVGGAKLVDEIGFNPERYHLNEAHGVSSAFYLYKKFNKNIEEVKKRLVFTTHTPEEAGNEKHDIYLCHKMSYFCGLVS